jgi:hypothetical protein
MEDVQTLWASLSATDVPGFVTEFVEAMIAFVEGHPAFLPLLDAPSSTLPVQSRLRLKRFLKSLLRSLGTQHRDADLELAAETVLQINKAMMGVYARSSPTERSRVAAEYRFVLTHYLSARFGRARDGTRDGGPRARLRREGPRAGVGRLEEHR